MLRFMTAAIDVMTDFIIAAICSFSAAIIIEDLAPRRG